MHLLPKISCNYFGTLLAGRHFDNAQPLLFAYRYMLMVIIMYVFISDFRHNAALGRLFGPTHASTATSFQNRLPR